VVVLLPLSICDSRIFMLLFSIILLCIFMEQSITIKTDELQPSLIEGLKKYFMAVNAKEITISFSTPKKKSLREESREDAKARIEKSIKSMEKGNSVAFTGEEFQQLSKLLSGIR
jgi:hypothetical protein